MVATDCRADASGELVESRHWGFDWDVTEPSVDTFDDSELARLKARDPRAQARFYAAHRARVEAMCARVVGAGAGAGELATDILGDFLFQYVDGVESPRAVHTYLKLMATRRSLRWVRKGSRAEEVSEDLAVDDPHAATDQAIWTEELAPRLTTCLERLTPKAREVLQLRFGTELTNEAIGGLLGGSKQYIGRLIKESTEKLKKCLDAKDGAAARDARQLEETRGRAS